MLIDTNVPVRPAVGHAGELKDMDSMQPMQPCTACRSGRVQDRPKVGDVVHG